MTNPTTPSRRARLAGFEPATGCLEGTTAPALCRPAKTQLASERKRYRQSFAERSSAVDRSGDRSGLRALPSAGRDRGLPGLAADTRAVVVAEDAETAGPANKIAAAERAITGQPLALSRIRPARVLVRNLLSSCSHGAESMEAAWGGRRPERKLVARDDGHPMARDGPEAKAVRVGQCYQMERMLRCLDLGTIASEDLCSEGGHSSGRLSEAS